MFESIGIDNRSALLIIASLSLGISGWVYGIKFLKIDNPILGWELIIMGSSGMNLLFFYATLYQPSYSLMIYLDAFSRAFGFPVLSILGYMVLTHRFDVLKRTKILLFVAFFGMTAVMLMLDFLEPILPYFYLAAFYMLAIYMIWYVLIPLYKHRKIGAALFFTSTTIASGIIATIFDFYVIPGDETNVVLNFFFLALVTWAFSMAALYYAYVALADIKMSEVGGVARAQAA